jgi:hypothetical protein
MGFPAFDFAALRSGRTGRESTAGEEVYQSCVVRFSLRQYVSMNRQILRHSRAGGNPGFCCAPAKHASQGTILYLASRKFIQQRSCFLQILRVKPFGERN